MLSALEAVHLFFCVCFCLKLNYYDKKSNETYIKFNQTKSHVKKLISNITENYTKIFSFLL